MTQLPQARPVPMAVGIKRPAPGWPLWLAFGLLLPSTLIAIALASFTGATSSYVSEDLADVVGNSAVVSGTYVGSAQSAGVPQFHGLYEATMPDSAPGVLSGSVQELSGPTRFALEPTDDFPQEQDFLVEYHEDDVWVAEYGDPGTLREVTAETLDTIAASGDMYATIVTVLWVFFALVVTVLPTLAIVFSVRRRQHRRAATHWNAAPPPGTIGR
jgi:hypothetical protein